MPIPLHLDIYITAGGREGSIPYFRCVYPQEPELKLKAMGELEKHLCTSVLKLKFMLATKG